MKRLIPLLVSLLTSSFLPSKVLASEAYIMLGAGISHVDIDQTKGEPDSLHYNLTGGVYFTKRFGIELGAYVYENLNFSQQEDSTGAYQISFDRKDIWIGPTIKVYRDYESAVVAKFGISYSEIDMTVNESFFGLKPVGTANANDKTNGYFLSLGYQFEVGNNFNLLISLSSLNRSDVFDQSDKSLDMRETSLGVSIIY
jgi:hypothetical protein